MVNGLAPVDDVNSGPTLRNGNSTKKTVAYFYDSDVGNYAYNAGHPMKPHRIRVAHALIMNYGCYSKMEIYRAKPASKYEMTQFHTDEYVEFLQKVTPDNIEQYQKEQNKYSVGDDCPVFDGLFEFCGISAGGSMEGAARLNRQKCDIAINWAGGLHHAKKSEASGFCYINDIVLGIIELLRFHQRVLYIDIDVHHGDGVEEAFYTTDRVMTVSFHKYGEYFPGTGELRDIGIAQGKHHSVNFPLRDGITDETYKSIFEPVIQSIMDNYDPQAIVLQCGGDSLAGDRLGCFNLSMKGHANCVNFVKSFNRPTLVLGGGGYTMRNVARTWAYETGQLLNHEMDTVLPYTEYYEYFCPDYELDVRTSNMDNLNSPEYLEKIKISVIENIRRTGKGSAEQINIPGSVGDEEEDEADDEDNDLNPDTRITQRMRDAHIERDDEFYSDNEMEDQASGLFRATKKPRILDGVNPLFKPGPGDEELPGDDGADVTMSGANGHANDEAEDDEEQVGAGNIEDEDSVHSDAEVASPVSQVSQAADVEENDTGDRMDLDEEADEPEDIAESKEEPLIAQDPEIAPESIKKQTPRASPTPPAPVESISTPAIVETTETVAETVEQAPDTDMGGTTDPEPTSTAHVAAPPASNPDTKSPAAETS